MTNMGRCNAGCRRPAQTWWSDDADRDWYWCDKCTDRHADALVAQGWYLIYDLRVDQLPA